MIRRHTTLKTVFATIAAMLVFVCAPAGAALLETVTFRSGADLYTDGSGLQRDGNVTFLEGPRDGPFADEFDAAAFSAAADGNSAYLIDPLSALRNPGLAGDPEAKWIGKGFTAEGGPGSQAGGDGMTALYAINFGIADLSAPAATVLLDLTYLVDDALGDANNEGLFINGNALEGTKNFLPGLAQLPTELTDIDITEFVTAGENTLYIYGNDAGYAAAGIVFSGSVEVHGLVFEADAQIPEPPMGALLAAGLIGTALMRRRRKRD